MFSLRQKDNSDLVPETISLEHKKYLKSVQRQKLLVRFTQIMILVLAFGLWELLASLKIVDPFITSQPSGIIKTINTLYQEGALLHHIYITCLETIIGLFWEQYSERNSYYSLVV